METITVSPGMHQMMIQGEPQVLQVLSLKDATALTKAMNAMNGGGGIEVKEDGDEKMYTIKWNPEFTTLHFCEWEAVWADDDVFCESKISDVDQRTI